MTKTKQTFIYGGGVLAGLSLCPIPAFAQIISSTPTPPPTLTHELLLVLAGAIFGGLFAPALEALDAWIGITPGAKQRRENYAIQRQIAEDLRQLLHEHANSQFNRSAGPASAGFTTI